MSALATVGAFALAHAGLTALALAMARHHRQLRPSAAPPGSNARRAWRLAGAIALALALWLCRLAWGSGSGVAAWFGVLGLATLSLILLLPYAPTLAWRLGCVSAGLGLLAMFVTVSGATP